MKLLWKELKKYKKLLALTLFLATVNQVFSMLGPQFFRVMIDNYVVKIGEMSRADFVYGILVVLLLSMGTTLVSRIAKAFQDYYVNVIVQNSGTNLYAQSVSHSFSLPFSIFEDQRSGELLNKLQKARTDSQALISSSVNILFFSLVGIIFVLVYALTIYWLIALLFFLMIPIMGGTMFFLSKKIKQAQAAIVKATSALSGSTTETLRNVELVKSLGLESQEIERLNRVNYQILGLELNKVKMVRRLDFVQGTLLNTLSSGIMFCLFLFILNGNITLGQFWTLWIYTFFVFEPLRMLGTVTTNFQEAKASLEQLDEVFKIKPVPTDPNAVTLDQIEGISFDEVSFAYKEGEREAVKDINIKINSGETVAFVGPSGSGKSTMIKLLLGLYSPTKGEVSYNQTNLTKINVDDLKRKIGLVAQDTQLFAGTIRENLLFVKPNATNEECLEALELAQAKTLTERTGEGLDTKIGESGLKLSGGEKQRLAIARSLLRDPQILIFDEATSSLDSITEAAITDTIKKIKTSISHTKKHNDKNITQVLVAHRLSTVSHADRIYVFEKGKIIETGNHKELIENKGLYAALWREQVGE